MEGDYYFMQDGAPAHTPAIPKIKETFKNVFAFWPPNSPGNKSIFYTRFKSYRDFMVYCPGKII